MALDQDIMQELQKEFLDEVSFLMDECEEAFLTLENQSNRAEKLNKIFRFVHSLKGTGASVGFTDLASFAHKLEDCLSILKVSPSLINEEIISLLLHAGDAIKLRILELKKDSKTPWEIQVLSEEVATQVVSLLARSEHLKNAQAVQNDRHPLSTTPSELRETSRPLVKVDPTRLEAVLDLVGELVVIKGQIMQDVDLASSPTQRETMGLLDRAIRELQDKTLFMRMTNLKPIFLRVQRAIRDVSVQLGKPVEFIMVGEDIEIDRAIIESLGDPLIHIARNAIDHGIEDHFLRAKMGKSPVAKVIMTAKQSAGRVILEVSDDGSGINREKVLQKAKERNLIDETVNTDLLPDSDIFNFMFQPGFSTAEKVTDISGRGVGLDVVKSTVERLKGDVTIQSQMGVGSIFRVSLPLTTAITDGIIVIIRGHRFVVPVSAIYEIVHVRNNEIYFVDKDNQCVTVRSETLPLLPVAEILCVAEKNFQSYKKDTSLSASNRPVVLVSEISNTKIALLVDAVLGQSQVVVKPLSSTFENVVGVSGASILGDGGIALVIDMDSLWKKIISSYKKPATERGVSA